MSVVKEKNCSGRKKCVRVQRDHILNDGQIGAYTRAHHGASRGEARGASDSESTHAALLALAFERQ